MNFNKNTKYKLSLSVIAICPQDETKKALYVTILLLTDLLVIIFCNASVIIWDNI
jgi:hypothetical protein